MPQRLVIEEKRGGAFRQNGRLPRRWAGICRRDTQAAQIAALQSQLGTAINGTSSNSNAVSTLGLSINNNPPQSWEVQPIADKLDELINTLRRP